MVVAVAEGGLYLILTSRRDPKPERPRQRITVARKKDQGDEEDVEPVAIGDDSDPNSTLRHRTITQQEDSQQ